MVKKHKGNMEWEKAPDIKRKIKVFKETLGLEWLRIPRLFVYRSYNSSSRAYARTWAFPKIWQLSLGEEPAYIIEFLTERFDRLSEMDQDKVILHELTHIPKNFSGSLLPHIRRGKNSFHKKLDELVNRYLQSKN